MIESIAYPQISYGLVEMDLYFLTDGVFKDSILGENHTQPLSPWEHPGCYWLVLE